MKRSKKEQFKLPRPKFDKNDLASPKLSDRLMGRSQYYAGVGWVKPRDSAKILNRGVPFRSPKFRHNWQVKHRLGNWISRPRFPLDLFGHKNFVLGIVFIMIILSGVVIAQGPLFHSYEKLSGPSPNLDPNTLIWHSTLPSNSLSEFNFVKAGVQTNAVSPCSTGAIGTSCLTLAPDNNGPALALTKVSVGDLTVLNNKDLFSEQFWTLIGTPATNLEFGYFLTTNATISASVAGYNPKNDPNTFLYNRIIYQGSNNFQEKLFIKRNVQVQNGGSLDTIASEDSGGIGSGSLFMITPSVNIANFNTQFHALTYDLNFTGGNAGVACGVGGLGPGCSFMNLANVPDTTSQMLPPLNLATSYYLCFFADQSLGATVVIEADSTAQLQTNFLSQDLHLTTISTPPSIDTGGFFGPVIKALVSVGVFILQYLITVFTFVVNVVKAALDAIGGLVGLGAIGTALFTILSAAGNFISSIVTTIGSQLANIVGFITTAASAIVAFLNSGGSFIWTQVTNFFNLWAILFPLFNTVFLVFSAFSQNGVQLAQYALIFWWLYGIFVVLEQGTEKWWNHWVGMGEEAFKKVFNLGYWMIELSFHWLVWMKNLLAQWV